MILLILYIIRNASKLVKKSNYQVKVSIALLIIAAGGFLLSFQKTGQVNVGSTDTRETNDIYFDDDYYIANDYSFDDLFSRNLEAIGNKNDILIVISTSGNSKNILNKLPSIILSSIRLIRRLVL